MRVILFFEEFYPFAIIEVRGPYKTKKEIEEVKEEVLRRDKSTGYTVLTIKK